jgi:hypothetical protein
MGDFAVIFEGSQIGSTPPTQTWFISSKFSLEAVHLSRVFSLQEWLSECCCFWVYSSWSSCRFQLSPRHSNRATCGHRDKYQYTGHWSNTIPVLMSCMYRYMLETVHFPVLPDISGYSHCKCDWVNDAPFGCTAYWVAVDLGCFSKAFKSWDVRPGGRRPEYRSLN